MAFAAPAPDFERTIEVFNSASHLGRHLKSGSDHATILKLTAEANRYKEHGYGAWYAMSSAVAALTCNLDWVRKCAVNVKAHSTNSDLICFAARSLIVAGLYTEAFDLLCSSRISFNEIDGFEAKLAILLNVHAYAKARQYTALLDRSHIDYSDVMGVAMIPALNVAYELEIPESDVRRMLDAAASVLSAEGLFPTDQTVQVIDHSFLAINFYLKTSPQKVAKLEWDYTGVVLSNFPEAPVDKVSIIFSSAEVQ